ncbi:Hypothetical predicted protein [Mytilus galloprovincialis]|uniref:IRG-type G domain-containing protein n=1 Tax=Mytilus galloprovincialis TaxID=29158 RepID=A0A8B6FB54_MYTGA|nr:Hypothetical predicted protein [Mytilus galloprovincialis]
MTEVKRLLGQMYVEGSEMFRKHLNKTLNKWRDEKVKFGIAGQTSTGKSSFINMLTGSTKSNEKRAKTSGYGNTTKLTTEYTYTRQRNVSFVDCPGFGTPSFKPQSYFEEMGVNRFDYIFIFFNVISIIDIQFAQALAKKDMKFCFVRTKLDIDIESAEHDSEENISPDSIASNLRETTEKSIQKEQFPKPSVFVISNRVNYSQFGHLQDLLSHIEQVLQKTKYDAFIYEIAAYTREVIKKKYDFLHERINGISFAAVVDEVEVATDFVFENIEKYKKERKSLNIINWLAKEIMLYIETFELSKKSSLTLIREEYVRQKLKFAKLLTTDVEKNVTIFIKRKLELKIKKTVKSKELHNKSTGGWIKDDKDVQFLQKEYPHLIPSINILSEVLDGLQHDALVIFDEFSKGQ